MRIFWIRYPSDYRSDHLLTDEEFHEEWRQEYDQSEWIKVVEVDSGPEPVGEKE